jgi:hypothetical protein
VVLNRVVPSQHSWMLVPSGNKWVADDHLVGDLVVDEGAVGEKLEVLA